MASLMRRKGRATSSTRAAEYTQHDTRFSWCWLKATYMQGNPVQMWLVWSRLPAVATVGMQSMHCVDVRMCFAAALHVVCSSSAVAWDLV